jgi:hypothetical protein
VALRSHLGKLTRVSGALPHPQSKVSIGLELVNDRLVAEVSLPAGVTGEFVRPGQTRPLVAGKSKLSF